MQELSALEAFKQQMIGYGLVMDLAAAVAEFEQRALENSSIYISPRIRQSFLRPLVKPEANKRPSPDHSDGPLLSLKA